MLGALLACLTMPLFDRMAVDDPVGASSVHGVCGIWGVIAVGLFADNPIPLGTTNGRSGLFKGGGWYLLGVQSLAALCLACWGVCSTVLLLWFINKIIPIRMDPNEELLGADLMEHRIRHSQIGLSRAISALAPLQVDLSEVAGIQPIGLNPGHERGLAELRAAEDKLNQWHAYVNRMTPKRRSQKASGSALITKSAVGKKGLVSGNILTRKFKGKKSKKSQHADNFIAGGTYKQNNNDISTISNVNNDAKVEPTFAWVD